MSQKKHPAYEEEVKRLDYTKEYIEKTISATEEYRKKYKENIKDAMIELDYLDSSLSYINIIVNTQFMEVAEKNYDSLMKVRKKPYFARIDFKRKSSDKVEKLYIGKTSLFTAEDNEQLIIDWRSPVASVYYEGRLGEVSYETKTGVEEGELVLKRQFTINDGELEDILDIDITTTDAFLQASLEAGADNRLKDIASTIQGEQNKVIRAPMNKPLIVQGVAGSGKTTIALHRIAYFMYTYEETFDPENFLIIAPNRLFINYISEVLPELGVERVKQTTFIDFMSELIGNKFKLESSSDKLMQLIQGSKDSKEKSYIEWTSSFKGSLDFKYIIDRFIKDIEANFVPDKDFVLNGNALLDAKEIKRMFLEDLIYTPVYKRINEIKKSLQNKVKYTKNDMLKDIKEFYDKRIDEIRENEPETELRRQRIVKLIDEREEKLKSASNEAKTVVKKYLENFPNMNVFDYYIELITDKEKFKKYSEEDIENDKVEYLCEHSKSLLSKKKIELEDYAAIVYLQHKLFGLDKKMDIKSIFIDEAQDFSLFQFYVLKEALNNPMFTILGDLSQGIHSYRGINNWQEVRDKVFENEESSYMTLVQSYRATIEVMILANEIIKKLPKEGVVLAKPVIRHGNKPEIRSFTKDEDIISVLEEKVKEMKDNGYKSIALICKTPDECKKMKKYLDKGGKLHSKILDESQESYEAGVIIVPSHLAKGLEFDIVFIVNFDEKYSDNELEIKLLYVAMTRTMHKLFIYHKDGTIPLLDGISQDLYI
jgi:DNA helicase II / ATP-dependent DNA helicase PcrA